MACRADVVRLILDCCHAGLGDLASLANQMTDDTRAEFVAKGEGDAVSLDVQQPFIDGNGETGDGVEERTRGIRLVAAGSADKQSIPIN